MIPIKGLKQRLGFGKSSQPEPVAVANLSPHLVCCSIGEALRHRRPLLVSRLGWFEAYSIGSFDANGRLSKALLEKMWNTPGIFPQSLGEFSKFRAEYVQAMAQVDILGLMKCPYEKEVIQHHCPEALLCELQDLEPYYHPIPWSKYLRGLRVLVVHPFHETIMSQYKNVREKIFADPAVLPEFDLQTIYPPQTMCGNTEGFSSWSDALNHLKEQIGQREFDVALIGCGSYGLPSGAFVKGMGKVAIHLGGATQLLFGIRGGRWDAMPAFRLLMNDHWCRPDLKERPTDWQKAEGGCYW